MGSGQRSNTPVVVQAMQALEKMKYEVANELNVDLSKVQGGYFGYMTTRETGAIGGNMVKKMIEAAERTLAQQAAQGVQAGFLAGLGNIGANLGTTMNQNQTQNNNQDTIPNNPNLNLNSLNQFF